MREEIAYDLIDPTPENVRQHYTRLEELAVSIAENGLLQNLVVMRKGDRFVCKAGERRRRAIGYLLLHPDEQMKQFGKVLGGWHGMGAAKSGSVTGGIPCMVIPTDAAEVANTIENIHREDLWPWELGKRLLEWNEAGYDQEYIGMRIGRSQTYVAKFITFGRCLSPRVTKAIEQTGDKGLISLKSLLKLCKHYDPVLLEPLHDQQVKALEEVFGHVRTYTKSDQKRGERTRVLERARKLARMKVPGHAKPYVRAIYEYLFSPHPVSKPDWNWK